MPSHPFHENIDAIILGRRFPQVHDLLDLYAATEGPNHRAYFHDDNGVAMVYLQTGDIVAAWSAFYHLVLDFINDDTGPEECISEFLRQYMIGEIPQFDPHREPPSIK